MASTVLVDRLAPAANPTLARDTALVLAGTLATALAAQINIPIHPVPFTLQTLAVAACGLVLGAKRGALSQALYLLAGLLGAPVFAEFKAGPAALVGPTGGYLLAFVLGAYLAGLAAQHSLDRKVLPCLLALTASMATVLALGTVWLGLFLGGNFTQALHLGVLPFLPGEIIKILLLTFALPTVWKLVGHPAPKP